MGKHKAYEMIAGGDVWEAVELSPSVPVYVHNIPADQWHTARALESGTCLLEYKDGKWEPRREEDVLWGEDVS